jgi:hypothetical protein
MTPGPSFHDLVRRIRAGDDQASAELVRRGVRCTRDGTGRVTADRQLRNDSVKRIRLAKTPRLLYYVSTADRLRHLPYGSLPALGITT